MLWCTYHLPRLCLQDQSSHLIPARCVSYWWLMLSPSLGIALSWRELPCTTGAWAMSGWRELQRPDPFGSSWDTSPEPSTDPYETNWVLYCICIMVRLLPNPAPLALYMLFPRALPSKLASHKSPSQFYFQRTWSKTNVLTENIGHYENIP